jgi:esterase/lipase superfamily enzyme
MTSNRINGAVAAFVVLTAMFASSCATMGPGRPQAQQDQVVVDLFYATDRKPDNAGTDRVAFGKERGELSYGACAVIVNTSVNDKSEFSERAFWMTSDDPKKTKDARLSRTEPLAFADLAQRITARQSRSSDQTALVYIHGYAKSFEEVAINTARLVYEIDYRGLPFFFSWPSRDSRVSYPADVATIAWSALHFEEFLDRLSRQNGITEIHLVAHSLGNRALLQALVNLIGRHDDNSDWRFGEVLLIAPDVDRDLFERDILPVLQASPSRITLYKSEDDFPLNVSRQVNQYIALGDAGGEPVAYPAIETIDVTSASTVFRGHSYFRKEPSVLADLHYLLNERKGAEQRPFLDPRNVNGGRYWRLQPALAE